MILLTQIDLKLLLEYINTTEILFLTYLSGMYIPFFQSIKIVYC